MIHKSKVVTGASRFIDTEILAKLKGGIMYWVLGVGAGVALTDAEKTMSALMEHPLARFYNLVDGEMIDIERLHTLLRGMAEKSSATINLKFVGPLTLSVQDVDKLYQYIREA